MLLTCLGRRASLASSPFRLRAPMSSAAVRKLEGRVAIVTASTEGIGFSIAKKLIYDGANVMVSSRKEANVKHAVELLRQGEGGGGGGGGEGGKVEGVVCHVGKDEHRKNMIQETISKFGKLDILVSNAAVNPTFGPTLETSESAWDKILDVNVKVASMLVAEAAPYLRESKCPSVVFVSSIGGLAPFSLLGAYSVSKTALLGLTKALAQELGPEGIRVNCIAPGIIKTNFSKTLWKNDAMADQLLQTIPLRRLGESDDCSGAVSFLCSDDASYITGETIVIAGGTQSRL